MIKKGFTLVELLAVFVLLAIIFMIAVPNVFKLISKGKSNAFLVSVRQVYKAGNIYRLNELREREEECVYFDFGEDYQIDTLVNSKMYIPIEELELRGDLPKEGEMEVCQDFVSITVSDGDNTVDIGPDGEEHVFEGNLEESNVSRPVIDNISTSKTTKSITTTVTAHDDKNDIVKYYYYLNGELKQSINNNVYEFTNLKDNTSYKIKIVVENSKGLKTSRILNIKTDELPSPKITVSSTGWSISKTVTITYPSGSNLIKQYKINSGDIKETYEKGTWITPTSKVTLTYTSEGSVSAKVSDGFNEKVVTYDVIEVDSVKPEVTVEPTIVGNPEGWVTMASIKGTITKKGPSPVELYRCLSTSYSSSVSCTPTLEKDNIVEDGSSLVLSSNRDYQKVCYKALSAASIASDVVCSDIYKVDTESPTITPNIEEAKVCLQDEEKWKDNFIFTWGISGTGTISCKISDNYDEEYGGYTLTCDATGKNGRTVSGTTKISPLGCYVNYTPDNELWDATRDGVAETEVKTKGIFNIYDYNTSSSANGLSKNESITCNRTYYKPKYSGWRIMNIDKNTGQITLIHGGTPECYYHNYKDESVASKTILKKRATSVEDEGEGKAWTKYGNSELALSVHYMDSDDANTIIYEENGTEEYSLWDILDKGEKGNCYGENLSKCGGNSQLIAIDTYYWIASVVILPEVLYSFCNTNYCTSWNGSLGVRPVIVLKPNVKLSQQESGLKGDEYSLITS